jgi:hypothetical protein
MRVPTSDLAPGNYLLTVRDDGETPGHRLWRIEANATVTSREGVQGLDRLFDRLNAAAERQSEAEGRES